MSKRNKAVLGMLCGLAALPAMAEDEPFAENGMADDVPHAVAAE